MPEFRYEYNEISIVDDTRFHKLLCFIKYHIHNDILTIEHIETTSFGQQYNNAHFGTNIFNALLLYLHQNNISIKHIEGKLSVEDAKRKNWLKSIPFYNSFPNWLNENLPYNLTITFYTDKSCITPIVFKNGHPTYNELITLINDYQNSKVDAFFVFQVNS